jgi:hypothetical protein
MIKLNKFVSHLTKDELLERLADELAEMHKGTYIDLGSWETARELVDRYYRVVTMVEIKGKRV